MSDAPQRGRFEPLDRMAGPAQEVATALARGRLHHAWLLTGPRGVGKAAFAWRLARRLLGAAQTGEALESAPGDRVNRLIAARAHPDLMVVEREVEDGKPRRTIPVDEIRRLPDFFAKSSERGGYRVALVDAVDDLAAGGANALLKTLEEPPAKGVLLLVSHASGRLLPTIRSRCRKLAFPPWSELDLAAWLRERGEDAQGAEAAARAARGSPGAALAALGRLDGEAATVLGWIAAGDEAALLRLADGFRGGEGAVRFATLLADLADALHTRITAAAGMGGSAPEAWIRAWDTLQRAPGETEALNLDRGDAFWTVLTDLRAAARVQPLAA